MLDLAEAVVERIHAPVLCLCLARPDMVHGKLLIVSSPGIVIDSDGLTCTYSKLKLHTKHDTADSRLRVEFAGTLLYARIIEKRP